MARRGKKPYAVPPVEWNVSLDGSIAAQVELLLSDPLTGKPKHGARARLLNQLLGEWVERQKKTLDNSNPVG